MSGLFAVILFASLSAAFAMGGQGSSQSEQAVKKEECPKKPPADNQTRLEEQHHNTHETCACNIEPLASYLKIDTTDLSLEVIVAAIKFAVEELDSTQLAPFADKLELDTTDMTDAEILAAIEDVLVLPEHNRLQINR